MQLELKARFGSAIFRVLTLITLVGAQDRGSAFQSDRLDFETRVVLQFLQSFVFL